jgi:hypothetical protein
MATSTPTVAPVAGKTPQQLFAQRTQRIVDALQLKQPDAVPVVLFLGYMLADMGGITRQEQHENAEKENQLLEAAALRFQADSVSGLLNNPFPTLALGDRMTRFPGHGLPPNGSFQFVEGEYMKPEDYDAFIDDPADWSIRKYWPRVFPELEGLALLPPLGMGAFGTYSLFDLGVIKAPPVAAAIRAFANAVEACAASDARLIGTVNLLAGEGVAWPPFAGCPIIEAPFDFMSDTLRGMRGIMLDVHRRPEKLLAAQEKVLKFELEFAINWCRATGINRAFIPLHRGSDGFMSFAQYEKFYWPQLKALQLGLVEAGIMPLVFYEGVWDQRLKYLAELPRGKTAGWFQFSDIYKVKEVLGETMCILGGMRNSLLQAGTAEQVRAETKKLCEVVGKNGGFIMSTGIGEMEGCKPELVKVWIDATREFGVY